MTQLALSIAPCCKERGCAEPVVGNSVTGTGHVCKRHNEIEWGASLASSADPYYSNLGLRMLASA